MKRKNREVSIFSMSALDLFASALGAFILITVVMFPYFPNTGMANQSDLDAALERLQEVEADNVALQGILSEIRQDLERRLEAARVAARREVAAAHREAEEARGEAAAAHRETTGLRQELAETEDELRKVRFPHLDLVIAIDITGSMKNELDGLKSELDDLTSILMSLAPSVAIGIVAFGDPNYYERPLTLFPLKEISSSAENRGRLARFVNDMRLSMGLREGRTNPTNTEAFLDALQAAAAMQWRSQSERKRIVLITDNPAYPGEVADSKSAAESFRARGGGRSVSTVFVRTSGSESGTATFLQDIAGVGGGEAVRAGRSMTANLLLSLL